MLVIWLKSHTHVAALPTMPFWRWSPSDFPTSWTYLRNFNMNILMRMGSERGRVSFGKAIFPDANPKSVSTSREQPSARQVLCLLRRCACVHQPLLNGQEGWELQSVVRGAVILKHSSLMTTFILGEAAGTRRRHLVGSTWPRRGGNGHTFPFQLDVRRGVGAVVNDEIYDGYMAWSCVLSSQLFLLLFNDACHYQLIFIRNAI